MESIHDIVIKRTTIQIPQEFAKFLTYYGRIRPLYHILLESTKGIQVAYIQLQLVAKNVPGMKREPPLVIAVVNPKQTFPSKQAIVSLAKKLLYNERIVARALTLAMRDRTDVLVVDEEEIN